MEPHRHENPKLATARAQAILAATLGLIAGYVDAYAFLDSNVYASFMSGNTTQAGLGLGQAKLAAALQTILPIPLFVLGVFAGTLAHQSPPHSWSRSRLLLALVGTLLIIGIACDRLGARAGWITIAVLSFAMGLLNTTVTRVGAQSVNLGYVTGTLNHLAQNLALAVRREPVAEAQGAWDTPLRRAATLALLWCAFLVGAALAAVATPRFASWTLAAPAVVLLALTCLTDPARLDG